MSYPLPPREDWPSPSDLTYDALGDPHAPDTWTLFAAPAVDIPATDFLPVCPCCGSEYVNVKDERVTCAEPNCPTQDDPF